MPNIRNFDYVLFLKGVSARRGDKLTDGLTELWEIHMD